MKALVLPNRDDPLWSTALHTKIDLEDASATPLLEEALHQALLTAQLSSQGLVGQTVAQTTDIFSAIFGSFIDRVNTLSAAAGLPPVSSSSEGTSTIPAIFVGGYGQSLLDLRAASFPIVKVGLQASIPIRNRTAIAQSGIAEQNKRQSITQQQQLEMNVESDIRNTPQQLVNSRLVLTASQRARALTEQQLASEQRQLQAGTSSVYLVLQRQNELVSAKLREIHATADCEEVEADFDRATANTLTKQNIDIALVDKGKI